MDWFYYLIAIIAGMLAAIINTLAGNGSIITLSFLLFMGLPADVANGTNRVGVLMQSLVATGTFYKSGKLAPLMFKNQWIVYPMFIGAIIGALVAVKIPEDLLEKVIGGLMILMLGVILIKPKRWLIETDEESGYSIGKIILFLGIGFYAGFIQMGMGVLFLAASVLVARLSLIDSNIIKLPIVALFCIPVLGIFWWNGAVDWGIGLTLAVGQAIGAWIAARFVMTNEKATTWIYYLLIVMVVAAIIKLLI